jgi:hypothetical protein
MTDVLDYVKDILLKIDPDAQKFKSVHRAETAYTEWHPIRPIGIHANGRIGPGWSFQVDRYTKQDHDEIAAQIFEAFDSDDRIAVSYELIYEDDTGYFRHLFSCEVM